MIHEHSSLKKKIYKCKNFKETNPILNHSLGKLKEKEKKMQVL